MKKLYILGPAIALAIFVVFYINFARQYEADQLAAAEAKKQAIAEAAKKEAEDRKRAIEEALTLQEQRKKEKAAKEAKDLAEKEARQAAIDARDKAFRDQEKLAKQVDRLKKEIEGVKGEIQEIEKEKELAVSEEAFLKEYVTAAEANQKSLEQVLQKIQAADKARAAAEAAAAKKS